MSLTFDYFLDDSKWTSLKDHYMNFNSSLEKNIEVAMQHDRRKIIRAGLQEKYGYEIKKENLDMQGRLKQELVNGNVAAVDGTCSDYDLMLGFQARIGIVAINYQNIKAGYSIYISEPFIEYDKQEIDEILEFARMKKMGRVGLSSAHVRAIMLYKERDFILKRNEKYKMVQGDILPYELKNGQGRLRGLKRCVDMGRRLLNDEHIIAIQGTTTDPQLRLIGEALTGGEYVIIRDYADDLNAFLKGDDEFSKPANFSQDDFEIFQNFISDAQGKFSVGVYKCSNRAYVFYCSTRNIEEMVNLVFADSHFQPIRGFPLLIDYADAICSRLLSSEDFKKQIEAKLAKQRRLENEMPERQLRRR